MIRIASLTFSLLFCSILFSQTTNSGKPTQQKPSITKPPVATPLSKDLRDSVSYMAGIHLVNKYKFLGFNNFNQTLVSKAINDIQSGKLPNTDINEADDFSPGLKPPAIAPGTVLKDRKDSASYAAGIYVVNFFRHFDIYNFNGDIVARAVNDIQSKKTQLIKDSLANMVALRYQLKMQFEKNKANIDAGERFLAENKKKPGVVETKSGLQYEIIRPGTGSIPGLQDKVSCHYTGAFIDGTEFNNSYSMGAPISFSVSGVIQGWTEALQMMPVGSKWKLYIPYTLGYGPGQYNTIPGGSALVFEIDLLAIVDQ